MCGDNEVNYSSGFLAYSKDFWPFHYIYSKSDIPNYLGLFVDVDRNNPSKHFWSNIDGNKDAHKWIKVLKET